MNSPAQENEKRAKVMFSDKIIHSFGFQFNNTFHAKGKFEFRDAAASQMATHPSISYGREYIFKYNFTFPSGWGITTEFVAGSRDFRTYFIDAETGKKHYKNYLWVQWGYALAPFFHHTYYGGQIKASYTYRLHERINMQPELGMKLLKYVQNSLWESVFQDIIVDEFGRIIILDEWPWFEVSNFFIKERFVPELTLGINFLFHTKRDPRHNFVLGINGTLGFIDRYSGWQRLAPEGDYDVRMKWGSSFFALNVGYEFTGFKKPFHKTKKYRKEVQQFETFDLSKPVHSFGVYFTSGFSFNPRMKETQGLFSPSPISSYVPELNLRYALSAKNGFGFAVEIPIGSFRRNILYDLGVLIPQDTLWADGKAVGPGWPLYGGVSVPYIGLTLKFSYLAKIHRNMFIQPEVGLKFVPFVYPSSSFEQEGPLAENRYYIDYDGFETDIVWLHDKPTVSQKNYAVPDITLAVNFMVHGKNPSHNFIFGINANICMVNRIAFEYHTTDVIPQHLQSSGKYGWKSSYIGFHIGYQFMKGKKTIFAL